MNLKSHFVTIAKYNAWANARLYKMARELPNEAYRKNVGAYFGSLQGTLNHILTADRIWMRRITGTGEHPDKLNAIAFEDLPSLQAAREAEDDRILQFIEGLTEAELNQELSYHTLDGAAHRQPLGEILSHFFNHQTHHRGQAHAILTILGVAEPVSLDLLMMFREAKGS
ncbi:MULTISPECIES: DinB family protein [Trichocoleus]|uniref:DinB family protein n=1 Tax=Trichocoleus desertorum GB2-A4 TaxID=2933944 RepID=A0ABV0J3W5_9CYAN|nr:DinB family protein [Trichocoleus sp. FACHB-46]MBD1861817.1 damage-inducible protein DinB [Trichocoleus sp. FACHB-46]